MANVNLKKDFKNGDKLYDYQLNNNFAAIEAALAAMNKIVWQDDEENGAGVSAYKGDTDAIEDRELIDGQLLYNTETGETYIDTYVDDELKRINTGSGNVVAIQDTEPTNEAVKLWIEEDTLDGLGSEVTNEYSESTGLAYSADYINEINTYSTDETDTGKVWVDGKKIYRKVIYYTLEQETGYPEFNTGITNADYVNMNITRYYGDNGGTYYVSMLSSFSGYFNKINGKITFIQEGSDVISGIGLYEFTIEYTKVESEES